MATLPSWRTGDEQESVHSVLSRPMEWVKKIYNLLRGEVADLIVVAPRDTSLGRAVSRLQQ